MAGGGVPGQGTMPQGTDAACRNEPAPGREGTLTGLAAAECSSAHVLLSVCAWAGTGQPLRSLQLFHYLLLQVIHPEIHLPRASGWFLWSWEGGTCHDQNGNPVPGSRGSRQGRCPDTGSTVGLAELCNC